MSVFHKVANSERFFLIINRNEFCDSQNQWFKIEKKNAFKNDDYGFPYLESLDWGPMRSFIKHSHPIFSILIRPSWSDFRNFGKIFSNTIIVSHCPVYGSQNVSESLEVFQQIINFTLSYKIELWFLIFNSSSSIVNKLGSNVTFYGSSMSHLTAKFETAQWLIAIKRKIRPLPNSFVFPSLLRLNSWFSVF